MAGIEAGEWVDCPSCGTRVLAKAMIPVLGEGEGSVRYICVACARAFIVGPGDSTAPTSPLPAATPAPADTLTPAVPAAPVSTGPTG